jgi:hypothetical protein
MRRYQIKIKTATGTRYQVGIFASKWAAVDAGLDMLGETEGNVTAQVQP